MALKFPKTIVEAVPAPAIEPVVPQIVPVQVPASDLEVLTTEYIELYKKYVYFEVKEMTKRMDDIRKQLQSVANFTMDAKQPAIFTCAAGEIEFSARGKEVEVPEPLKLIKDLLVKLGPEATESVVNIAITPLRKLLSEHELTEYLKENPGGRTLKAVRTTNG